MSNPVCTRVTCLHTDRSISRMERTVSVLPHESATTPYEVTQGTSYGEEASVTSAAVAVAGNAEPRLALAFEFPKAVPVWATSVRPRTDDETVNALTRTTPKEGHST